MILKTYINKDIYQATGAILMVLILIFVSTRFVKYIQLAVDGTISAKAVFTLLALQIPAVAGFLIPLSFFLAILLTFGRLYSDSELVVVHGLGLGQRDLAKMLMPMALVFALLAGCLSMFLTPWATAQSKVLMAEQAAQAKLGIFSAGRFRENSKKDGVVFVESKSSNGVITGVFSVSRPVTDIEPVQLEPSSNSQLNQNQVELSEQNNNESKIQVQSQSQLGDLMIQTAKRGRQWENEETGVSYLVLEQGQFNEYNKKEDSWGITSFDSTYTRIIQDDSIEVKNNTKSTSSIQLIKTLGNQQWAALHWRLAAPLSIPLICLLAVPLSRTQPRQGKFGRLLPSIMIYLIYVLLMMYSRKLIESGKIPGALGFWWIHAGLVMFIYWLYRPTKMNKISKRNNQDNSAGTNV